MDALDEQLSALELRVIDATGDIDIATEVGQIMRRKVDDGTLTLEDITHMGVKYVEVVVSPDDTGHDCETKDVDTQ